ncbi:PRD domain-containing protein [Streptococcus saliviloxodontae]|uniref:Transcriptional antiterminator n=1 Tax=Streptococcus saliviloxodontae TaxID=1349416 RepID=A0ABS2PJ70_9STRE|nr:transcriptional antiterminator [Streptococcus saliviloxodontae]
MILLDNKSYDLLAYLIKLEEPETIMAISKHLNQSRRKIYYHLDKINEALPSDIDPIISFPRIGIVLTEVQKQACQAILDDLHDDSYVMSIEERLQLIEIFIAISMERVTIERLMQLTFLSRNTVLNDLNTIRNKLSLEEYSIRLQVTKARGYFLDCHPLSKIQYIYRLLFEIYTKGSRNFIDIVEERLSDSVGYEQYFSEQLLQYLKESLASANQKLGKKLNPQDKRFMLQILPYLLASYHNTVMTDQEREEVERDFALTRQKKEYQLAEEIAKGVHDQFGLKMDDIEISLIAMLLLSYRKDSDDHLDSQEYDRMREVLTQFLETLKSRYQLHFKHQDELLKQLMTHSKALLYRKTYGILSGNPLTDHIKEKYENLFLMVSSCVDILENAWFISLSDDDVAYFVIHIGGEIKQSQNQTQDKAHVVIVCDEGIAIKKLLLSQCHRYLPNCNIDAVFTTEQYQSVLDLMEVDFIISTGDLIQADFPVITVSPILTDDDVVRLIRFAKKQGQEAGQDFEQSLEKLLTQYVDDDRDRYALKSQIEKLINRELLEDILSTRLYKLD